MKQTMQNTPQMIRACSLLAACLCLPLLLACSPGETENSPTASNSSTLPGDAPELTITETFEGAISLSWTYNGDDEDEIQVERRDVPFDLYHRVARLTTGTREWTDWCVRECGRYYYRVRARHSGAYSDFSLQQEAYASNLAPQAGDPTPADGAVLDSLTNLRWDGRDWLAIRFSAPGRYGVYVGLTEDPPQYTSFPITRADTTWWVIYNPLPDTTYYWRVDTFNNCEVPTRGELWQFNTGPQPLE